MIHEGTIATGGATVVLIGASFLAPNNAFASSSLNLLWVLAIVVGIMVTIGLLAWDVVTWRRTR